jgi:hypothetical protein
VFNADDGVFGWAIGKAVLILMVSIGALVYLAWAVTRRTEIESRAGASEDRGSRSESAVKAREGPLVVFETTDESEETGQSLLHISAERNDRGQSGQSTAAA